MDFAMTLFILGQPCWQGSAGKEIKQLLQDFWVEKSTVSPGSQFQGLSILNIERTWKVNQKKKSRRPLITYIEYTIISYLLQHLVS